MVHPEGVPAGAEFIPNAANVDLSSILPECRTEILDIVARLSLEQAVEVALRTGATVALTAAGEATGYDFSASIDAIHSPQAPEQIGAGSVAETAGGKTEAGHAPDTGGAAAESVPGAGVPAAAATVDAASAEVTQENETIAGRIARHPTYVQISVQKPRTWQERLNPFREAEWKYESFADDRAGVLVRELNAVGGSITSAPAALLEEAAFRDNDCPHEVVAYTTAGDEYARHMPEDSRDEPGVVVDYFVGSGEYAKEGLRIRTRKILPLSLAGVLDARLEEGDLSLIHEPLKTFLTGELDEVSGGRKLDDLNDEDRAALNALEKALSMVKAQPDVIAKQTKYAKLVRMSNTPELAAGASTGEPGAYSRKVTKLNQKNR